MTTLAILPASARLKLTLSVDALQSPLTGIGRYTLELAHQLARRNDLDVLYMRGDRLLPGLPTVLHHTANERRLRDSLPRFNLPTALYRRWSGLKRAQALNKHSDRLLHGTNFQAPAFNGRSVLTLHDASLHRMAHTHQHDRVRYLLKEVERSLRQASLVITVSEFSRQEIATLWGWPYEDIRVTPLAASAQFHPHSSTQLTPVLQHLGLRAQGYCLYVGTVEPRKNLTMLLDAYARLAPALRTQYPLVISGHPGWESDTLHHRFHRASSEGWLRYLGFVDACLLPALMAGARLFVYPSRYEGFGLPVLEAMASGVPVICSTAASLPEVAAQAATYVAPDDLDGWQQQIERGLEDDAWQQRYKARGLERATDFSWQRCADLTVAAYREVQGY